MTAIESTLAREENQIVLKNGVWGKGADMSQSNVVLRAGVEADLATAKSGMNHLVEESPDGILVLASDGTIRYANAMANVLFEDRLHVGDTFGFPVAGNAPADLSVMRKDKSIASVEMRVGEIVWNGERATIVTLRDVTERQLAKAYIEQKVRERTLELKKRYDEIEQLTYAVAHDLMVPLVTIKGFIGFLKKDIESGNRIRIEIDLSLVEDAAERMEALLSRTLELSSIGKLSDPTGTAPFGDLVQEALSLVKEYIKSHNAEISIANDFPVVKVDRPRIVEVVVNLIKNSIKHAGEGISPKIEIGYRMDGDEAVFFVKDEGVGMDPVLLKNVFKLFYKDGKGEGSDLGLPLSRRIIEVHGGRMWIESCLGKGCIVYFTLPAKA